MSFDSRMIRITKQQFEYLRDQRINPPASLRIFDSGEAGVGEIYMIRISAASAEEFRDKLTRRLAEIGFDQDYEITAEGRMLEELIDRLNGD